MQFNLVVWQCLQKGGGVQQLVELCREIIPALRWAEPAFLRQRGTASTIAIRSSRS